MLDESLKLIRDKLGEENVLLNEPMKDHISFKAGGPAKWFLIPKTIEDIEYIIKILSKDDEKYFILGNGSNVLVRDEGYDGTIILIKENFDYYRLESNGTDWIASVAAGMTLKDLSNALLEDGLCGFEFASGIPGCMGGAMAMNAGAYGGEMKDIVCGAKVLDKSGKVLNLSKEELEMGYRTSAISKNGYILLEAKLCLKKDIEGKSASLIEEYTKRREEKQPLELPSAGSTFKRPEGYYAGKLIMDAGLRGYRHGGAMVSEKHCGFVVNAGNATADDIISLIKEVQEKVYKEFGVKLEPEVRII